MGGCCRQLVCCFVTFAVFVGIGCQKNPAASAPLVSPQSKTASKGVEPPAIATTEEPKPVAPDNPQSDIVLPSRPNYPKLSDYKHKYKITQEYDRFKDSTILTLDFDAIQETGNEHIDLQISNYNRGKSRRPGSISFYIFSAANEWKFLKVDRSNFLLDDVRYVLDVRHDSDLQGNRCLEHMHIRMDQTEFLRLVDSETIEFDLGYQEFKLSNDQVEAIRDFASYLDKPDAPIVDRPALAAEAIIKQQEQERVARQELFRTFPVREGIAGSAGIPKQELENRIRAERVMSIAKNHAKNKNRKAATASYRAVIKDFPDTPQADEARTRLKEMGQTEN